MNPLLFMPLVDNNNLSEKVRKFFRFGVPDITEKKQEYTKGEKGESQMKTALITDFRA